MCENKTEFVTNFTFYLKIAQTRTPICHHKNQFTSFQGLFTRETFKSIVSIPMEPPVDSSLTIHK